MMAVRQATISTPAGWSVAETTALDEGLRKLGLDPTPQQQAALRRYCELLLKWNRTYNLLGATTATAMLQEHVLDSLAVVPAMTRWLSPTNAVLIDVGTGAGLPGIILAIMMPQVPVVLVEPVGKKAAFLRQVVAECRLPTVRVFEARIEDIPSEELLPDPGKLPHFICRAFASLDRFAELCAPRLREGSLMFAMKAAKVQQEVEQLAGLMQVLAVEPLSTVEREIQRYLVVMRLQESRPGSDSTRPAR
jgi:16S rRNA (guanine527-N7)-methyltransferase